MSERGIPEHYLEGYARLLAEVAGTGRRLTRAELAARRTLGEQAAEAGHELRALVSAHLAATRAAWPQTPGAADCTLAAVQQAVDAFAEGYERAQRLAVRQEEAARREFIDDLLYGRSDLGRLAERAERFGLRLSHAHAVAVAQGPAAYDEGDQVPRQVERALMARFGDRSILLTTKDGRLLCVAPGHQGEVLAHFAKQVYAATDGCRVAVGRPQPGSRRGRAVVRGGAERPRPGRASRPRRAGAARRRPSRLPGTDPRPASDGRPRPRHPRPLTTACGGAEPLLDTLTTYFDSGCVAAEAARRLTLSVRALTYRLERIHKLTGADPADPAHRYMLQTAVIGARLLDWPAQEL